tara:strand:- start:475 stop:858 length:384 start_codon:yes stop_codon:yes gene_type:complete
MNLWNLWDFFTNKRRLIPIIYSLIILDRKGEFGLNNKTLFVILGPAVYIAYIAMVEPESLNILNTIQENKLNLDYRLHILTSFTENIEKIVFIFIPVYLILQYIMWGDKLFDFYHRGIKYVQSLKIK